MVWYLVLWDLFRGIQGIKVYLSNCFFFRKGILGMQTTGPQTNNDLPFAETTNPSHTKHFSYKTRNKSRIRGGILVGGMIRTFNFIPTKNCVELKTTYMFNTRVSNLLNCDGFVSWIMIAQIMYSWRAMGLLLETRAGVYKESHDFRFHFLSNVSSLEAVFPNRSL